MTVGPLMLGSAELRELRERSAHRRLHLAKHEVTLRDDDFRQALGLVDAILEASAGGAFR